MTEMGDSSGPKVYDHTKDNSLKNYFLILYKCIYRIYSVSKIRCQTPVQNMAQLLMKRL